MSSLSAPGMSLKAVFEQATLEQLKDLIGPAVCSLMGKLGAEPSRKELAKFAHDCMEQVQLLQEEPSRHLIFDMLPDGKIEELGRKLNVPPAPNPRQAIKGIPTSKRNLGLMLSFFGVVQDSVVTSGRTLETVEVRPQYPLFDHQRIVADKTLEMLEKHGMGVLHLPTGAGKTRTAMHVVARYLSRGPMLVCWLAQSAELLLQASEAFEEAWKCLGNRPVCAMRFWGAAQTNPLEAEDGILVAGLGKLWAFDRRDPQAMLTLADRVSLVVVDEAHHSVAPTHSFMISSLHTKRPNTRLLGLTATPGRTWADISEDAKLSDFFGREKVSLDVEGYPDPITFLIDQGFLARPTFRTLESAAVGELEHSEGGQEQHSDVPEEALQGLGASEQRNMELVLEAERLLENHRRVILFAPSVASARLLAAILLHRDHRAFSVTGESREVERQRAIRQFRSNQPEPMILCNYGVLTTGFDAPETSAAIIARPTRSLVLYSQMVGRATRGPRVGGNATAEVVTVVDTALPGFGDLAEAFKNWEDVWNES